MKYDNRIHAAIYLDKIMKFVLDVVHFTNQLLNVYLIIHKDYTGMVIIELNV